MDPNRYMITQGCKKNSDAMTEFWCNDPKGSPWTPRMWITHQNWTYPSLTLRGYIRPDNSTPITQSLTDFCHWHCLNISWKKNKVWHHLNLTRLLTIHCAHIYSRATNVSQVISVNISRGPNSLNQIFFLTSIQ